MLAEHGQEMPEAGSPLLHRQLIALHDITDYERINNSKRSSLFRNHALLKEAFVKAGGGTIHRRCDKDVKPGQYDPPQFPKGETSNKNAQPSDDPK